MERPSYIPILKWQICERDALRCLCPEIKHMVLPCIEVRLDKNNIDFCQNFEKFWDREALVDYSDPSGRLDDRRWAQLQATIREAVSRRLPITPVVNPLDIRNPNANNFFKSLVPLGKVFFRPRVTSAGFSNDTYDHLKRLTVRATQQELTVGIIIDFGCTPAPDTINLPSFANLIRKINDFGPNSVHVASGAYPDSLKEVGQGTAEIERSDWKLWNRVAACLPDSPLGFSDYATVSPNWTEDVRDKRGPLAIRYTVDEHWLIVRGGSDRSGQEAKNLAQIFFEVFESHIEPLEFSAGDRNIHYKANRLSQSNAQKLGIKDHVWEALSHHISYVVKKQYQCGQGIPKSGHAIF